MCDEKLEARLARIDAALTLAGSHYDKAVQSIEAAALYTREIEKRLKETDILLAEIKKTIDQ